MPFFAESIKPFSCWNCHYFTPENAQSQVNGWCRRGAPCTADLYGPPAPPPAGSFRYIVQAGAMRNITNEDCYLTLFSGEKSQAVDIGEKYIGEDGAIFNDKECFPIISFPNSKITHLIVSTAAMAVAGTPVPAFCNYDLTLWKEAGATRDFILRYKISGIPAAYVNANGSIIAKNYYQMIWPFNVDIPIPDWEMWSYQLDLSPVGPDDGAIVAMANVNTAVVIESTFPTAAAAAPGAQSILNPDDLTLAESLAKYAVIPIGPNTWCGDYKRNSNTVPDVPPYTPPAP